MADLEELEKVMNVYEEVGGGVGTAFQEQMDNLVTPYRKFVRTEQVGVKRAPFSSAREVPSRAYFFDDLVLIAEPRDAGGSPSSIGSMLETGDAGKRNTLKRFKDKYRVTGWLDLHRCSVKEAGAAEALQLTFVTRLREEKKTGTVRVLTRVQKLELWFNGEQLMQEVLGELTDWIDELIELDLRRPSVNDSGSVVSGTSGGRESMVSGRTGDGTDDGGARRGWAQRKGTLRRHGTLKSVASNGGGGTLRSRKASGASAHTDGDDDGDSVGGLSLSDLESRYKQLNLTAPAAADASVEYGVEYGEGMMGFRLSSGPSVGVIVGKVADGSFSDEAGVCIGDRVTEVGDSPVGMNMAWQDVVELIKRHKRPLVIRFERFAGRAVIGKAAASAAAADAGKGGKAGKDADADEDGGDGALPRSKSEKRRAWATRKAQHAHTNNADGDTRLSSLKEVEQRYKQSTVGESQETHDKLTALFTRMKDKGPADEAFQAAARVLEEIWASERNYVGALRTLVKEFIIPLRRKQKRVRCKDQAGSLMCEHNLMRSACSRMSSTADSLLSGPDIRVIFLNVETIVMINSELLAHLEADLLKLADAKAAAPSVADVAAIYNPAIRRIMPFIKLYAVYCHQYPTAIDYLLMLRTNEAEVNDAVTERERKANATLSSLLITPVQRVCRYPLLFRELLKHMRALKLAALREQMDELEKTTKVVEAVADDVNKTVGDSENSENMLDVYNELGGGAVVSWLIEPSRKFVTKVNVLMHEAPYSGEAKMHILYLCTDLLLFGKPTTATKFGSLKKTGGKGGVSRAVSLRRAFGNSLAKHASHATDRGSSSRKSNSLHRSGTHGTGHLTVKLVKTVELSSVKPKLLADKDDQDCFGIELTYVERALEAPKKGAKGGSGKQVTNINKLRVWLPSESEQREVFEDIDSAVTELKRIKADHKKAQQTLGASSARATRTWKKKAGLPSAGE